MSANGFPSGQKKMHSFPQIGENWKFDDTCNVKTCSSREGEADIEIEVKECNTNCDEVGIIGMIKTNTNEFSALTQV